VPLAALRIDVDRGVRRPHLAVGARPIPVVVGVTHGGGGVRHGQSSGWGVVARSARAVPWGLSDRSGRRGKTARIGGGPAPGSRRLPRRARRREGPAAGTGEVMGALAVAPPHPFGVRGTPLRLPRQRRPWPTLD